jgi:hypothetical protein
MQGLVQPEYRDQLDQGRLATSQAAAQRGSSMNPVALALVLRRRGLPSPYAASTFSKILAKAERRPERPGHLTGLQIHDFRRRFYGAQSP